MKAIIIVSAGSALAAPDLWVSRPSHFKLSLSIYLAGTLHVLWNHNFDSDNPFLQLLREEWFQGDIWQQDHVVCKSVEQSCTCDRGSQCKALQKDCLSKRLFQDGGLSSNTPFPSEGVLPSPTRMTSALVNPNNSGISFWNRRPSGIVINKNHRTVYILEFKWSFDRNEDFLRVKEDEANEQHKSIIEALKAAAPEWTFEQFNFVAGRRGAVVEGDFYNKLKRLGVQARKKQDSVGACATHMQSAWHIDAILLSANIWVVWGWRDNVDREYWRTSLCVNNSQSFCHQLLKKGEEGAKLE